MDGDDGLALFPLVFDDVSGATCSGGGGGASSIFLLTESKTNTCSHELQKHNVIIILVTSFKTFWSKLNA